MAIPKLITGWEGGGGGRATMIAQPNPHLPGARGGAMSSAECGWGKFS